MYIFAEEEEHAHIHLSVRPLSGASNIAGDSRVVKTNRAIYMTPNHIYMYRRDGNRSENAHNSNGPNQELYWGFFHNNNIAESGKLYNTPNINHITKRKV